MMHDLFHWNLIFPYAIPPALTLGVCIFLASLTIRQGKHLRTHQLFTLLCFWQIVYNLDLLARIVFVDSALVLRLVRLDHLFYVFSLPISVHFVHEVLELRQRRWLVKGLYALSLGLLPFTQSSLYIDGVTRYFFGFFAHSGPLLKLYAGLGLMGTLYAILLFRSYRGDQARAFQVRFLMRGFLVLFALNVLNALPTMGWEVYPPGNFGFLPMLFMAYGIFEHRLLETGKSWLHQQPVAQFLVALAWSPVLLGLFWGMAQRVFWEMSFWERLWPAGIPFLFCGIFCLFLASLALLQNHDLMRRLLLVGLCWLWGLWSVKHLLNLFSSEFGEPWFWSRMIDFFLVHQLGVFAHLLTRLFKKPERAFVWGQYSLGVALCLATQTQLWEAWGDTLWGVAVAINLTWALGQGVHTLRQKKELTPLLLLFSLALYALGWGLSLPPWQELGFAPWGCLVVLALAGFWYLIFRSHLALLSSYTKLHFLRSLITLLYVMICGALTLAAIAVLDDYTLEYVGERLYPWGWPAWFSLMVGLFFSVVAIRVGRLNPKSTVFSFLCLGLSFFNLNIWLNAIVDESQLGLQIHRSAHLLLVFMPALWLHLSLIVARVQRRWWELYIFYGLGLALLPFTQSAWYFSAITQQSWGIAPQAGPAFHLWALLSLISGGMTCFWLYRGYLHAQSEFQKEKLRWLGWGSLGTGALWLVSLPSFYGGSLYPAITFSFLPLTLLAYGIFRRKISEVLHLVRWLLVRMGLVLGLALLGWGVLAWGPAESRLPGVLLLSLLWWLLAAPWRVMLERFLDLVFPAPKYDLEEVLYDLTSSLSLKLDVNELRQNVIPRVLQVLDAQSCLVCFGRKGGLLYDGDLFERLPETSKAQFLQKQILLESQPLQIDGDHPLTMMLYQRQGAITQEQAEEWMHQLDLVHDRQDPLFRCVLLNPIFFQAVLVGMVGLGEKLNGEFYSREEQMFIRNLCHHLGSFIENARLVHTLKEQIQLQIAEKERIAALSKTFRLFVPEQFLSYIAKEGMETIKLGNAESTFITILFSDIRNFTQLSEVISPQELFLFLNQYFQRMHTAINQYRGFIDKFIGDAIMALYDQRDSNDSEEARSAVLSAIAMQNSVNEFNRERALSGYDPIQIGIGIHSGPVYIGTVGSETRMDSTVIGDAVNLAARLEGLTKLYGCKIIISQNTLNLLANPNEFEVRELDWLRVKGKMAPVRIYEVLEADPPELRQSKQDSRKWLRQGLEFRHQQRWAEALECFYQMQALCPKDTAAAFHLQNCLELQASPPPLPWDGAIALGQK